MYLDTIQSVIRGLVDEFTGANGVKLIRKQEAVPMQPFPWDSCSGDLSGQLLNAWKQAGQSKSRHDIK
jgi:hypothetical protein